MSTINLVTDVPGPRSQAMAERKLKVVSDAFAPHVDVVIDHGHGTSFTDIDGNTFLDFAGGVGPNIVGYSHPKVVEAVKAQVERFGHTDFGIVPYESFIELSERIVTLCGGEGRRAALFNSGAEAVENAIKVAKAATGRKAVICFDRAFHGRTHMAMSLTSKQDPYKTGFGPFAPEVYRVPFPYPYRSTSPEGVGAEALAALEQAFVTLVHASDVAAVIVEPIQGEGGFIVPPRDFLPGLADICKREGIVLIADEVQSGSGRTGKFLAMEHFGVEPDIVVLAKALGGGYPISAIVGTGEVMSSVGAGRLGGTYVGNPVACASANATLQVIEDEDLMTRADLIEKSIVKHWEDVASSIPEVGDIRGIGAMMAVEFVTDRETKEPHKDLVSRSLDEAARRGLIAISCGIASNVIRHLVPLNISEEDLDEGLNVLVDAISASR